MPEISVIIPMFNAEESIERCLNSLLTQTFEQEYEILVIDDGSSDQCGNIVKQIATHASNIRYYFHENQGISYSRNFGMQQAQGEYLCFVDSDDYVHADYLRSLYDQAVTDQADIAVCDFYECSEKQDRLQALISFHVCSVYDMPELVFAINTSPWNKLFKRSFLTANQITFPIGKKYEDAAFMLTALAKARRITKVNAALVYYQVHEGSETTSMDERVFDIFDILLQIEGAYRNAIDNRKLCEYLAFFAINRISVYQLQQIYQRDRNTALTFVNDGFSFLNAHYPDWQSNVPFRKANGWAKRILKTSPFFMRLYVRTFWKGSGSYETD